VPEPRPTCHRLLAAALLLALPMACVTPASQAEVAELRVQVRVLQEARVRLEKRLERVELHATVSRQRSDTSAPAATTPASSPQQAAPKAPGAAGESSSLAVPELTVVKLKPRAEPAPALPTHVAVVEPEPEDMEAFVSAGSSAPQRPRPDPLDEPDPDVLEARFQQSLAALRTGNVQGAVEQLTRFAEENPRHARADNALYFGGLGLMGQGEHAAAAPLFERLMTSYPAGDTVLDAMLRLAECRLKLNQREDARALYTRVLTQFPGTAAATQAEQRLASLSKP
jgi:TolA-binding protein